MIRSIEQATEDPGMAQTQTRELRRVRSLLGRAVFEFCNSRINFFGGEFRMEELYAYVARQMAHYPGGVPAPDSASRILRLLRKEGVLSYTLLSRRGSLYRIDCVNHSKF